MKKILILLLIITTLISTSIVSYAQTNTYTVTASALNVRNAPGIHGTIIGSLYRGQTIIAEVYNAGWASINYYGRRAYVSSRYLSATTQQTNSVTSADIDLLARLIESEAGSSWITDEHQLAVGSVVLNRVADSRFPNTIKDVIYQKGQYGGVSTGTINRTPSQRALNNARYLIENGTTIPSNVVWQAEFRQGYGVWKYIQGHYFCY